MIISELSKELVHFFHFITPKSSFRRTSYLISSHIQLISSHIRAHFVAYPGHFVAVAHPGHLHFVAYPSSFRRISRSFHRKSERFWDVVRFFVVRFSFVFLFQASLLLSSVECNTPHRIAISPKWVLPIKQRSKNVISHFSISKINTRVSGNNDTRVDISVQLYPL
jgi:hypothetical protein